MVLLFLLYFFYNAPIICDDVIFQLNLCGDHLEEKYVPLPIIQHFMQLYPETTGLGYSTGMYQVQKVFADAMLAEKIFVRLEIDLRDSSIIYSCSNHNKGDDFLVSYITNPTVNDLDSNNCRTLNNLILEK